MNEIKDAHLITSSQSSSDFSDGQTASTFNTFTPTVQLLYIYSKVRWKFIHLLIFSFVAYVNTL